MTDVAPWRLDVPTQSEPVSPPPITTTCLPVAQDLVGHAVARDDLVLLRQELHREMDAVELAARHRQVARLLRAAREHDRVELVDAAPAASTFTPTCWFTRNSTPSACICSMRRSIRCFLHLEIGNAVAQQPADAVGFLEHDDGVAGARELLRAGEPGRARSR